METLLFIIAFWLILMGAYGAMTLRPRSAEPQRGERPAAGLPVATKARAAARRQPAAATSVNGLSADIDFLRNQIEHLRTEVLALSGAEERPRPARRSRGASAEAELPQPLRRQVREARVRRPVQV